MIAFEITVMFYGTVAGLATLSGIILMRSKQEWAIKRSQYVNSFAAGLILALVFFHLLPEASELSEALAFPTIFLGFFGFYLLENFIVIHSGSELHFHESDPCLQHTSEINGVMAFSGLALHSLIDGVIIGVGFELGTEIGVLAALAVIAHEVPEGVTSFALINETLPEKSFILSVLVAIATPIGALVSLVFVHSLTDNFIGILLALAAGTFIYVSASDLIPQTHGSQNLKTMVSFLLGAFVIILISFIP
ncbi:MAG: ZIP family metal transporter [Candidatus Hodarchaeales archaeon]|jgi:ZIP family zinc transporter/zinc and cadmium transporter